MNLLLVREIIPDMQAPDFGAAFMRHMESKTNPAVRSASTNAWALLAEGLNRMKLPLPEVGFSETGKPFFRNSPLHFSLSHSGQYAAVLIAGSPCGVDIEQVREIRDGLIARCMHPEEIAAGMDFVEAWTKKECIAKLDGVGMRSRPNAVNSLEYAGWFTKRMTDCEGGKYQLSAFCANEEEIQCKF